MDSKPQNAELPFGSAPQFRLKAGLFPLTQLDISDYEHSCFEQQLRAKAAEAPAFFQHTPVVLNLEPYQGTLAPPVQEMSDARQAITVAREAGAADHAATELAEAEKFLQNAEDRLDNQQYREARHAAIEAKYRAQQALKLSEATKDSNGN